MQSRVDGHLLLDPTDDEAYQEDGGLLLAYMPQASLVSPALSRLQHQPILYDASVLCFTAAADPSLACQTVGLRYPADASLPATTQEGAGFR